MKIVHLVTDDIGGAGRAARRINESLNKLGYDSSVIVLEQHDCSSSVVKILENRKKRFIFKCIRKIYQKINWKLYEIKKFSELGYGLDLNKMEEIHSADIVHLHWINYCMISKKGLMAILKEKTVVWTLHDMWPLTAGCYYDNECGQYKKKCSECPLINVKSRRRITERAWTKKNSLFSGAKNLVFVGCSSWITDCARNSALINKFQAINIPNPINVKIFSKVENNDLRNKLRISKDHKIILFGAMSSDSDERKGYRYLKEAIKGLTEKKCTAVVFGNSSPIDSKDFDMPVIGLGRIKEDYYLAEVYSMADVFAAPSSQENLSNAVMESLSCSTPVVAFDIGGMSDMIKHQYNGYLAKPFNTGDFMKGIEYCFTHPEMGENARTLSENKFSMDNVGRQYLNLYESSKTLHSVY